MNEEKGLTATKIRKNTYWAKLQNCLDTYKNFLLIGIDFVGSKQIQQIRLELRGSAVMLMGKNTIMRKVIRENLEKNPALEAILPFLVGNVGFIFTNGDLNELRKKVTSKKVPAAAKTGVLAPVDVIIPAGPTGLDPGQTSFFQTLNIATKIAKGAIEITNDVKLITKDTKVSASAVALLNKLNIKPFEYGITASQVFENGSVYAASVLDMTDDILIGMFCSAVSRLAAISFEIGEINLATVPHSFARAFKMLASIALSADYMFEELKIVKEMIENPDAFGGPAGGAEEKKEDKPAAAAAVEEEEEEAAPAVDMFGGDEEEGGEDY